MRPSSSSPSCSFPVFLAALGLTFVGLAPPGSAATPAPDPATLTEDQRAFFLDGPALLVTAERRSELLAMDEATRKSAIAQHLADPDPATPVNELALAIARRQGLAAATSLSFHDDRAKLAFLRGAPSSSEVLDCGQSFRPIELWTLDAGPAGNVAGRTVVFYRPEPTAPFRLWRPLDGKRSLYISEMEYWLEQWEELGGRGKRFDHRACPKGAGKIDDATGVEGLFGYRKERPTQAALEALLAPPADLAVWAREALAAVAPAKLPEPLEVEPLQVFFPERRGQRMVARGVVHIPASANLQPFVGEDPTETAAAGGGAAAAKALGNSGANPPVAPVAAVAPPPGGDSLAAGQPAESPDSGAAGSTDPAVTAASQAAPAEPKRELRLAVEGVVEQGGRVFETFQLRFRPPPPPPGTPVVLQIERALRTKQPFVLRLRVRDELSGREVRLASGFMVPDVAVPIPVPALPEAALVALGEDVSERRIAGRDSLILVPPSEDVVLGLWRAEALVTGERISRVSFLLDGKAQLARARPPFTAEMRLAQYPIEQTVRAEGYDKAGELVDADEVILNQPRGALRVRVLTPLRGSKATGAVAASAEVVVPEGRRVEQVEFRLNDTVVATLARPPWEATLDVPVTDEVVYLTVTAALDDGSQAEDFRFLNAPGYIDEVDVDLVELLTTVVGSNGRPLRGLGREAFTVLEDGVTQNLAKFEAVEDLPLRLGMVLDTSGSMVSSLTEAQQAARDFLNKVMTPRDSAFVLSFSDRPIMQSPPTEDLVLLLAALDGLQAVGSTALHDALMTGLYYFRGIRGRRALVLLSDGDDTASATPYRDMLEYARRSGVTIYPIGLNVSPIDLPIRNKLDDLAKETGGRVFYASNAAELAGVYEEIELELRAQYLLAYSSSSKKPPGQFRKVEVKVKGGNKARTMGGYYP